MNIRVSFDIIFIIFQSLLTLAQARQQETYSITFAPNMYILDIESEKIIPATATNLKKLLENPSFRQVLVSEKLADPLLLKNALNKYPEAGRGTPISRELLSKLNSGKGIRQQILTDKKIALAQSVEKVISTQKLLKTAGTTINCIELSPQEQITLPPKIESTIEISCDNTQETSKTLQEREQEILNNNNYKEAALEYLKDATMELKKLQKDIEQENNNVTIAFIKGQLEKTRIYLKKDELGCHNPYKDFFKNVLLINPTKEAQKEDCTYQTKFTGAIKQGKGCYPQSISCMDKQQEENFEKIREDFEFEKPADNKWLIKFPVIDEESNRIISNYSYKQDDFYALEGLAVKQSKITLKRMTSIKGELKSEVAKAPQYFIKKRDGRYTPLEINNNSEVLKNKFLKARYPFFRPTDQCSVAGQSGAGVCYQKACQQHDLCFQTLPNLGGDDLREHFNKCNDKFKRNISRLCEANEGEGVWSWINNRKCHLVKRFFDFGVQSMERLRFKKGHAFLQSQIDQYSYLEVLYKDLRRDYCDDGARQDYQICREITQKLKDLDKMGEKFNLEERNPYKVNRSVK